MVSYPLKSDSRPSNKWLASPDVHPILSLSSLALLALFLWASISMLNWFSFTERFLSFNISLVKSNGKPKVSYNLNALSPLKTVSFDSIISSM